MNPTDAIVVTVFVAVFVVLWIFLIVMAIRQINAAYRETKPLARIIWIVAIVAFPIMGSIAWLLWSLAGMSAVKGSRIG
ncbi:PLDc N-terminal domain-containing protein [Microbacterium sp. ZW T5_56]|uniref:PLDc N-terminal domain-containing protein n=1 Tax=Microbacterium sp. ZW T5_56 TaxID=3378081 RepID=UPI003853DD79